jgi:hypothetical protein
VSVLPIRLRLTLAFAVVMAAVLTGMGAFVYVRVGNPTWPAGRRSPSS